MTQAIKETGADLKTGIVGRAEVDNRFSFPSLKRTSSRPHRHTKAAKRACVRF
jgi:hypothetical protein